jgi:hypothetical protein
MNVAMIGEDREERMRRITRARLTAGATEGQAAAYDAVASLDRPFVPTDPSRRRAANDDPGRDRAGEEFAMLLALLV